MPLLQARLPVGMNLIYLSPLSQLPGELKTCLIFSHPPAERDITPRYFIIALVVVQQHFQAGTAKPQPGTSWDSVAAQIN